MRYLPAQLLAFFIAFDFASGAEEKPYVTYKYHGGRSPYVAISATVSATGRAHATIKKRDSGFDYDVALSVEELRGFQTLVRIGDFFSQPDREPLPIPLDTGETEISVREPERERTLKFCHRPELDPLCQFFWKLVGEAEAFHDVNEGRTLPSLPITEERVLLPARLKPSLIKFALAQTDLRKSQQAIGLLLPQISPEELIGLIDQIQAANPTSRAFLAFVGKDRPFYLRALCPVYLDFVRDNYSRRNEFSQWENELFTTAVGALTAARYQPAIPLFLEWFDSSTGPTMSGPWSSLPQFGVPGMRALIPKLDSKDPNHRLQALHLLTTCSRLNPESKLADPVSETEYEEIRKLFALQVLPKLQVMMEKDQSAEVRTKAYRAREEIRIETNKRPAPVAAPRQPPPSQSSFVTISVDPNHTLNRTLIEPEPNGLTWVIVRDGQIVLERNARNETQFKYPDDKPGVYSVYMNAFLDGAYRVISNIVYYEVGKPPALKSSR